MKNNTAISYKPENIEDFFEDIVDDYGYKDANHAKFEAAKALVFKKQLREKAKIAGISLFIFGLLLGYLLFNLSIINLTNGL